jgi:hypothetical protein
MIKELRIQWESKLSCRVDGYKERFYNKQNISQFGRVWFWAVLYDDILYFASARNETKYLDGITNRFRHLPIDV